MGFVGAGAFQKTGWLAAVLVGGGGAAKHFVVEEDCCGFLKEIMAKKDEKV